MRFLRPSPFFVQRKRGAPPGWVLYDYDDFAGAAGALTTTVGGRSYLAMLSQLCGKDGSGNMVAQSPFGGSYDLAIIDVGSTEQAVEIAYVSDSGSNQFPVEVRARMQDESNYFYASYNRTTGQWAAGKRVAGTFTTIAGTVQALSANDRVRLEVTTNTSNSANVDIIVKVNDIQIIQVAGVSGATSAQIAGAAQFYQQPKCDNLKWWVYQ
jgi:hypothetical protein